MRIASLAQNVWGSFCRVDSLNIDRARRALSQDERVRTSVSDASIQSALGTLLWWWNVHTMVEINLLRDDAKHEQAGGAREDHVCLEISHARGWFLSSSRSHITARDNIIELPIPQTL